MAGETESSFADHETHFRNSFLVTLVPVFLYSEKKIGKESALDKITFNSHTSQKFNSRPSQKKELFL
jgi:hypothetical protein